MEFSRGDTKKPDLTQQAVFTIGYGGFSLAKASTPQKMTGKRP
jgi:hypothetical protein